MTCESHRSCQVCARESTNATGPCESIETKGESYRLHDAKARTRRSKPATPVDEAQAAE
jgi:hypothetical protein